jgi:hypothetical protein
MVDNCTFPNRKQRDQILQIPNFLENAYKKEVNWIPQIPTRFWLDYVGQCNVLKIADIHDTRYLNDNLIAIEVLYKRSTTNHRRKIVNRKSKRKDAQVSRISSQSASPPSELLVQACGASCYALRTPM